MAKSPRRRANSRKPQRRAAGHAGRWISVMISSGFSAVVSAPWKKSAALMVRAPALPTTANVASQVCAMPGISEAGSAWAQLPPTVPRLRDLVMRDVRHRLRSSGCAVASRLSSRMSRQRTSAPSRTPSGPILISLRPGSFRRSTSSDGWATRNAIIGTSDWPPASALASPSWPASSATASLMVAGQAYSKAGSFMHGLSPALAIASTHRPCNCGMVCAALSLGD